MTVANTQTSGSQVVAAALDLYFLNVFLGSVHYFACWINVDQDGRLKKRGLNGFGRQRPVFIQFYHPVVESGGLVTIQDDRHPLMQ